MWLWLLFGIVVIVGFTIFKMRQTQKQEVGMIQIRLNDPPPAAQPEQRRMRKRTRGQTLVPMAN